MRTSLERLNLPILAHCLQHLNEASVSQLALVSKCSHLAARYARSKPKHLGCSYLNQEALEKRHDQIVLLGSCAANPMLPLFTSLGYHLAGQDAGASKMRNAPEVDLVIQILRANKGVSSFCLGVTLTNQPLSYDGALLSAIRDLAAAAQCKDGLIQLEIKNEVYPGGGIAREPTDLKVKAILGQLPNENALIALYLERLVFDDLKRTLEEGLSVPSLRKLQFYDCSMSTKSVTDIMTLAKLETLTHECGDLPVGIITGSAATLRKLQIAEPNLDGPIARLIEAGLESIRADFGNLQEFVLQVDKASPDEIAIRNMFLINDGVAMPVLQRLLTNALDESTSDRSLVPLVQRLPSLRHLRLVEPYRRHIVSEKGDDRTSGNLALAKACDERQIRLRVDSDSPHCTTSIALAAELQRISSLQGALGEYCLTLSIESLKEPVMPLKTMHLSELRTLSLSLDVTVFGRTQGQKVWGDHLIGILEAMSAPKCERLMLSFGVRLEFLETAASFLEKVTILSGFPGLVGVTGQCAINLPEDTGTGSLMTIATDFKDTVSELQTRTGIDFSGFRIVHVNAFEWWVQSTSKTEHVCDTGG